LLADNNENHMLMLINCWILDRVCDTYIVFSNQTLRLFFDFSMFKWNLSL